MWRVVAASVIGTSHQKVGTPCQDACSFLRINSRENEFLLIAVADGAGSASFSQIGSFEAVHHLLDIIVHSNDNLFEVDRPRMTIWLQRVLNHLQTVADREKTTLDQLACTFLCGIISTTSSVFCQIGDGCWVIEKDDAIIAITWPQTGEFANLTTFITSKDALDLMQFERTEGKLESVAAFTDGIQLMSLNYKTRTAHAPFFKPIFDSIRNCDDETSLMAPLQSFLASETVNDRTDDDKTLVLACWHQPKVE